MRDHRRHPTATRAASLSVALLSDRGIVPVRPAGITFRKFDKAFNLCPDGDLLLLHGAGIALELGAAGYLLDVRCPRPLETALACVHHGVSVLTPAIAQELCLTEKSMRNYLDRVYRKLGVRSRTMAVLCRLGQPPLPPTGGRAARTTSRT